ncbi:Lin1244/Lin1753 domain-containing protein [Chitinophaga cymbidii]|nr:Lin1244/Lin1753 domain-containing protein [Chitinophaga cymbidii]
MKERYWFKHDYNARLDPKLQRVLMKHGQAGKGVFWDLLEMLYEAEGYLSLSDCDSYAFNLRTDADTLLSIITDFDLFKQDDTRFWNERILSAIETRQAKSDKARIGAKVKWDNYANASKNDANVLQSQCNRNATAMLDNRSKNIENNNPPLSPLQGEGSDSSSKLPTSGKQAEAGAGKPLNKPLEFPSPEFEAIWKEWIEFKRTEKRKRYRTQLAEQKGITHLVNLSGGDYSVAKLIVEQSMAQNWEGLFALKNAPGLPVVDQQQGITETSEQIRARLKMVY